MSEPTIPTEPTIPGETPDEVSPEEEPQDETPKAGRPSNKQLAAENKRLLAENQSLRSALSPLGAIPDERGRPDDFALFDLSRGGVSVRITNRDVRAARKLLSL